MAPRDQLRLYAFVLLLTSLLVVTAVVGGHGGTSSSGTPLPPLAGVDRIAYVDNQGQIWSVRPDGSDERRLTRDDGFYTWPTWSPDAYKLAFSGVVRLENGDRQANLYSLNTVSGKLRELHQGEPGVTNLVANGAPHYIYWSPNGRRVAFVGTTEGPMRLYLDDLTDRVGPEAVLESGPLWMAWSASSRFLMVHRGLDHYVMDFEKDGLPEPFLVPGGLGYRVPAWMPTGDEVTVVSGDEQEGYTLYVTRTGARRPDVIDSVPQGAVFSWSPDGEFIAVTRPAVIFHYVPLGLTVYQHVGLYGASGTEQTVDLRGPIVAFMWSPDSAKIAYLTLTSERDVLRLNILDVEEGVSWPLLSFIPSAEQLTMLQFFDQFAHSHQLWSPDSTALVLAGTFPGGADTVSSGLQQQRSKVIVVSAERRSWTREVGDGVLAFWSPR